MDKNEKYHLEEIFQRFIEPHFSTDNHNIFFEWDRISGNYRYVVTPMKNKNRFISFYLLKHDRVDGYEMVVIYTSVGNFNFHNTQKLLFLLAHDDLERFNRFYQDFIDDLDEKCVEESPVDFYIPFSILQVSKNKFNSK